MAGNFALNVVLSAGLSQLWSMINTQQIIVVMPLFNTNIPANAGMFFGFIMNLASFNLLPTDEFYNSYMVMSNDPGALNSNFDDQGYGSVYLLQNLGTLLVAILTIPLFVGLYYVLKPLTRCSTRIKKVHLKLKNYLFWSHQIQVIFESYSVICMCALINLKFVSVFVFTFLGIFQYLR